MNKKNTPKNQRVIKVEFIAPILYKRRNKYLCIYKIKYSDRLPSISFAPAKPNYYVVIEKLLLTSVKFRIMYVTIWCPPFFIYIDA